MSDKITPISLAEKLQPIIGKSVLTDRCISESHYNIHHPKALPTQKDIKRMCASSACHELMKKLRTSDLPNSASQLMAHPVNITVQHLKDFAENFSEKCVKLEAKQE